MTTAVHTTVAKAYGSIAFRIVGKVREGPMKVGFLGPPHQLSGGMWEHCKLRETLQNVGPT